MHCKYISRMYSNEKCLFCNNLYDLLDILTLLLGCWWVTSVIWSRVEWCPVNKEKPWRQSGNAHFLKPLPKQKLIMKNAFSK